VPVSLARIWSGGTSRRRVAVGVLLASVILGAGACSSGGSDTSTAASTPATAAASAGAASTMRHLDAKAFAQVMNQTGTVLLDVRTPAEYATGHIAKATNLDVQASTFASRIASLDKSASYALYCHSGNRSGVAGRQMIAAGFTTVVDLAGGVGAWTAAGNQLATG
jgi:phage shock protein E